MALIAETEEDSGPLAHVSSHPEKRSAYAVKHETLH
jgi:hypothetical protein